MLDDMIKLTIDQEFMYFYQQVISVNNQLKEETIDKNDLPSFLADEESLKQIQNLSSPELQGFPDNKNIWDKMMNIHNRNERKEAKALYNQPIKINSKYAFNIKNRDFKIKKYMNY